MASFAHSLARSQGMFLLHPAPSLPLVSIFSVFWYSLYTHVHVYTRPFFLSFYDFELCSNSHLASNCLELRAPSPKKTARSRQMTRRWYFIFRRHTSTQSVRPSVLHRSCIHTVSFSWATMEFSLFSILYSSLFFFFFFFYIHIIKMYARRKEEMKGDGRARRKRERKREMSFTLFK